MTGDGNVVPLAMGQAILFCICIAPPTHLPNSRNISLLYPSLANAISSLSCDVASMEVSRSLVSCATKVSELLDFMLAADGGGRGRWVVGERLGRLGEEENGGIRGDCGRTGMGGIGGWRTE